MFCPKCGKELSDSATICTSCGWKTERWKESVKKSRTNLAVTLVSIAIWTAVAAICVILFLSAIFS